ncbi:hypothetical protein [Microvirga subterranea]|uniref:Uncharacterized protein n=1 Tax=Microvirga subterranea TaxID=186651 RepID=A0A370HQD7_9HYPH|nr:hypothetical protein [Microvirga subterranea]RDI60762.1 hypothetical protein DES45_102149 [Microvirga subterranea]
MPSSAPHTDEWHKHDIIKSHPASGRKVAADLAESRWAYDWCVAGTAYSGLWLLASWTAGGSALQTAGLFHMAHSLATLLLALAACTALYKLCGRVLRRLAPTVAIISGIIMLVAHSA